MIHFGYWWGWIKRQFHCAATLHRAMDVKESDYHWCHTCRAAWCKATGQRVR